MPFLPRIPPVCMFLITVSMSGCESCASPESKSEGCTADDGSVVTPGSSITTADGCNVCLCTPRLELLCTAGPCRVPDPSDAGPSDGGEPGDAGIQDGGAPDDAGTPDAGIDDGPCPDVDGDGFHRCVDPQFPERPLDVDCDDNRFHVQPRGYEFPDTGEDDNCNGTADDWARCDCPASGATAMNLAAAMDLCGASLVTATRSGEAPQFGAVAKYQDTVDPRLRSRAAPTGEAPIVLTNACLATLSTGDAVGVGSSSLPGCEEGLHQQSVSCGFCFGDQFSAEDPGVCDLARMDVTLQVPPNASGFAFDFMFLSYEWPEFLCDVFNDTFQANVQTVVVNAGQETNAALDPQGRPITVNVGFFENPTEWTVPLDGSSFGLPDPGVTCAVPILDDCSLPAYCVDPLDGRNGSGSGWLTTSVPVRPGEGNVRLTLRIHDEGDSDYDSVVLVDNFRWLPFEPVLRTGKDGSSGVP